MLDNVIIIVSVCVILYFIFVNIAYIILYLTSISDIFYRFNEIQLGNVENFVTGDISPPVTIIVPAFNEEDTIINSVRSFLKQKLTKCYVIVVNDGSEDKTMDNLIETFALVPAPADFPSHIETAEIKGYYVSQNEKHLIVIDKEHAGKGDSLNVGLNACRTPIFLSTDSDTFLEPESLDYLLFSLLSVPHTIAEGGAVYVANGCTIEDGEIKEVKMPTWYLPSIQTVEYLRAFLFGRCGMKPIGGPLILPGSMTMFEKKAVLDIGGFSRYNITEDLEIILRLHKYMRDNDYPYNIGFTPSAVAWTNVPESFTRIWQQRGRWHAGLFDALLASWRFFFNPKYKAIGLFNYPFYVFVELFSTLVEFAGYSVLLIAMYLHKLDWYFALLFFLVSWGFSTIITMATVLISLISFNKYKRMRDIIKILILVIFENLGYRQLLVTCRFLAMIRFVVYRGWLFITRQRHKQEALDEEEATAMHHHHSNQSMKD